MYQHSKSAFLLVTLDFELEYMDISSRHSPSDFDQFLKNFIAYKFS